MRTMLTQLILANFGEKYNRVNIRLTNSILFSINLFNFKRMLEKEPEKRFSINEVDKAIRSINLKKNLKSKDIFEGIFNL
jgi:hypothetical protein